MDDVNESFTFVALKKLCKDIQNENKILRKKLHYIQNYEHDAEKCGRVQEQNHLLVSRLKKLEKENGELITLTLAYKARIEVLEYDHFYHEFIWKNFPYEHFITIDSIDDGCK